MMVTITDARKEEEIGHCDLPESAVYGLRPGDRVTFSHMTYKSGPMMTPQAFVIVSKKFDFIKSGFQPNTTIAVNRVGCTICSDKKSASFRRPPPMDH